MVKKEIGVGREDIYLSWLDGSFGNIYGYCWSIKYNGQGIANIIIGGLAEQGKGIEKKKAKSKVGFHFESNLADDDTFD